MTATAKLKASTAIVRSLHIRKHSKSLIDKTTWYWLEWSSFLNQSTLQRLLL